MAVFAVELGLFLLKSSVAVITEQSVIILLCYCVWITSRICQALNMMDDNKGLSFVIVTQWDWYGQM